jgi:CBS domain-containing protein
MKVHELMTTAPVTVLPDDNLAFAAQQLWENDCGVLPVVQDGRLLGLLTDRDIAMALGMRGLPAREVRVADVLQGTEGTNPIFTCSPDTTLADALKLLVQHQVRRLPVVEEGHLVGLLSLNDVALEAKETAAEEGAPTYEQVGRALQGICVHRLAVATA